MSFRQRNDNQGAQLKVLLLQTTLSQSDGIRTRGGPSVSEFYRYGIPEYPRSDNWPEFTAKAIRRWLGRVGVKTLFIGPESPWENGYMESFNGKLRDELLNREVFTTLTEAKILIEQWKNEVQSSTSSQLIRLPATCS